MARTRFRPRTTRRCACGTRRPASRSGSIEQPEPIWALAVSPDGSQIVTGTGGTLIKRSDIILNPGTDNVVRVWDAASGKLVRELTDTPRPCFAWISRPTAGWRPRADGTARSGFGICNLARSCTACRARGGVMHLKFSPDGRQLLVGGGAIRTFVGRLRQVPDEQVRLYQVVEAGD